MKKEQFEPLTPEELQALKSFAAYAGRTWKDELRNAWMAGSMPGHLHKLRNSHGPAWLNQFKLPQEAPRDIVDRCQNCGSPRKAHGTRKPYACRTRLKDTVWTPWTIEAYQASVEAGRAVSASQEGSK